jgi:hypothetical protein
VYISTNSKHFSASISESCPVGKESTVPIEGEAGETQSQYEVQLDFTYPKTGYPDRLDPSGKHFRTTLVIYIYLWIKCFPHLSNTDKELYINILSVHK